AVLPIGVQRFGRAWRPGISRESFELATVRGRAACGERSLARRTARPVCAAAGSDQHGEPAGPPLFTDSLPPNRCLYTRSGVGGGGVLLAAVGGGGDRGGADHRRPVCPRAESDALDDVLGS